MRLYPDDRPPKSPGCASFGARCCGRVPLREQLASLVEEDVPEDWPVWDKLAEFMQQAIVDNGATTWQEIRALEIALDEIAAEFDGEDPLKPAIRELINDSKAPARRGAGSTCGSTSRRHPRLSGADAGAGRVGQADQGPLDEAALSGDNRSLVRLVTFEAVNVSMLQPRPHEGPPQFVRDRQMIENLRILVNRAEGQNRIREGATWPAGRSSSTATNSPLLRPRTRVCGLRWRRCAARPRTCMPSCAQGWSGR